MISDAEYDSLCVQLFKNWDKVPARYKPLLDPDDSEGLVLCTTGYQCRFTRQVESGAIAWLDSVSKTRLMPLTKGHMTGKELETEILKRMLA